jgi:hypothetical protein
LDSISVRADHISHCIVSDTLAPFVVSAVAGSIEHRIYPIRSGEKRWYISSFYVPLTIINTGAVPGFVTCIRLRLHYPEVKITDNRELIYADYEIDADKVAQISSRRFDWITKICRRWTPFAIPAKAAITSHSLIEVRWEDPVIQNKIEATLEIQTDWADKWQEVGKYRLILAAHFWMTMVSGSSFTYAAKSMRGGSLTSECHPPSLHTRTRPTTPLPDEAPSMKSSYLDYPSNQPDEEE